MVTSTGLENQEKLYRLNKLWFFFRAQSLFQMAWNELMEGEINAVKTQLVLIKQDKGLIGKSMLSLSKFNKMYFYIWKNMWMNALRSKSIRHKILFCGRTYAIIYELFYIWNNKQFTCVCLQKHFFFKKAFLWFISG